MGKREFVFKGAAQGRSERQTRRRSARGDVGCHFFDFYFFLIAQKPARQQAG